MDGQESETKEEFNSRGDEEKKSDRVTKRDAIIRRDQVWDRDKRQTKLVKSERKEHKLRRDRNTPRYSKSVLLVRRVFSELGLYSRTEVDVKGRLLQAELQDIHKNTKGVSLSGNPMTVDPKLLYLSREELGRRGQVDNAQPSDEHSLKFEIDAVLQFINDEFESMDHDLKTMLPKNQISWPYIWTLLKPNALVYAEDSLEQPRIYRVRTFQDSNRPGSSSLTRAWLMDREPKVWVAECECVEYNGDKLGYTLKRFEINSFEGTMAIDELPVYPLRYHQDHQELRKSLLERAEKALQLHASKPLLQEYRGHGLTMVGDKPRRFNSHGRIVVDPLSFRKLKPDFGMIPRISASLSSTRLSDDEKLTISPMVYGFSFGDKTWGAFTVDQIDKLVWDNEMYKALVFPKRQKELILQLIKAHDSGRTQFDDFVRNKGKGLVGLLMGPPGLGKTLTAEAIAEAAEKPLYMMSSGDLGDSSSLIAENLGVILELATTWNAVLLIDEADVFLEKRTETHLERNSVTSIFLRHLEYYPGILILTTNRAGSFDPAFQSRIHFCFKYPHLDSAARLSIWESFMEKAKKEEHFEVVEDIQSLEKLSKLNFNGRQIKNAMSIAVTLAKESKKITATDIIDISTLLLQNFGVVEQEQSLQDDLLGSLSSGYSEEIPDNVAALSNSIRSLM